MERQGIILAGGSGTRWRCCHSSEQALMPVCGLMIHYPLST